MKVLIFILIISQQLLAQELYIPTNIQSAYSKKTRSFDGKPGENYWQNKSDYHIKVNFNSFNRTLTGWEKITYYNNSPNSLTELIIRLYPNITKSTAIRDFSISQKGITDGVTLKRIILNKSEMNIQDEKVIKYTSTNAKLFLPDELLPKSSLELEIEWSFQLPPTNFARMGTYDSTSFFIAYWYPQIAVYDDIDGWDQQEYTGFTEMYNDFNNYKVEINIPRDYHVWATGIWKNPEQILSEKFLNLYLKAQNSDEIIRIFKSEDIFRKDKYKSEDSTHTFVFEANEVPDFAFGVSNKYLWDATSYLSPTGKRIFICAAYKESSKDFYDVAFYAKESIKYFSEEMPGYPFPYPSLTVWNGSGGMEYPMIVNNGSFNTKAGTVGVTAHEIAHQYMPFMMGINERKYAFMDEGWAVFFPLDLQDRLVENINHRTRNISNFNMVSGSDYEVPPIVLSYLLKGSSYRIASYSRSSVAYDMLYNLLGKDLFKKALHHFIDNWKGKHPTPWDFFNCINYSVGKNLNWFFKPWFFEFGYSDLALSSYSIEQNKLKIKVEKVGQLPVPIKLKLFYNNQIVGEYNFKADIWSSDNKFYEISIEQIDFDKIVIGDQNIPDVRSSNNVLLKSGN
ncbi:MAG: M1 family metallopeptidase [Ignavibacterium sp.]|nr:M1 family metallopeptidase [Ignavibacterium sp.]